MNKKLLIFLFFWGCCFQTLLATAVGNPANPALFKKSLFFPNFKKVSLRTAYFYDNIYKSHFEEDSLTKRPNTEDSSLKITSQGGIITFNFLKSCDIYTKLGIAKMSIEQQFASQDELAWGVGAKCILYKKKNFFWGLDFQYFHTTSSCEYLNYPSPGLSKEIIAKLKNPLVFVYDEYQLATALSYRWKPLVPYLGATYLFSSVRPLTPFGTVYIGDQQNTYHAHSNKGKKNWGLFLGVTLFTYKIALTVESRMFDQNSVAFIGDLRF